MLSRCSTTALAAALVIIAPAARAEPSAADRATARTLAQQGQDALDAKDWSTAADRFARADALVHAPTLMLALARAEVGLGRWVAALEHLNRIEREGVPAGAPPSWSKALQEAKQDLSALEPRVPAAVITVRGRGAPRANVTVDGAAVPAAALGVARPVDPGKHTIRAEAEGFDPAEVTLTFTEKKVEQVVLQVDQQQAVVPAAATESPVVSPLRPIGFAGVGVGGAGLLMGAITGGLALAKHADLASKCPGGHCTNMQGAIDAYNLVGVLSTAGFVAGGALAATGVVLLVVDSTGKGRPKEARIEGVVGPGYAGVRGRF
jgi:hypothetical protein